MRFEELPDRTAAEARAGSDLLTVDGRTRRAAGGPGGVLRPPAGRARRWSPPTAPGSASSPTSCTPAPRTCSSSTPEGRRRARAVRRGAGPRGRPRGGRWSWSPTGRVCSSRSRTGLALRIDVVSIFPDYLAPLGLSLPGKARERGLVDLQVHDLRAWTHDRHRTVDDTPYGGGAGMVMKPEPWGEALDELVAAASAVLVRPRPRRSAVHPGAGADARDRGTAWCSPAAATKASTSASSSTPPPGCGSLEVSVGDYVLNGGEVAALAMIEAVVRLLPGFMGNAGSLARSPTARRAARVPRLHQAGQLARARRPRGPAVR